MRKPLVVKVGGNEVDDTAWLREFAAAVARMSAVVVVHGGGKEITTLQRILGAEPGWRDGLRYTSPEAMRAVSMVLSGVVNKRIVAALLDAGRDALGLSGEDGALLRARLLDDGALGRVGEVTEVREELLHSLLFLEMVPVLSPVSRGPDGGPLNVNADDAAAAVAGALHAGELLMVSNVACVMDGAQPLARIGAAEVEPLIASGAVSGGMAPKLRAALRALRGGVGAVRIGGPEMLDDPHAGTRIELTGERTVVMGHAAR
jgi:acetylglutamate kinase